MEKQAINVSEELERLQRQIGRVIVGSTQNEAGEVKKRINKLVQDVEQILVHEAGIPRTNAHRIIENMQDGLNYQIGRNLAGSREAEYNETIGNLATVEKPELQGTSDELARFQADGIASKNNKYCANIEEICEEVIQDYRRKLGNMGTRGAEDAYLSIKNKIGRTSNELQDIHEEYSRRIKQDVFQRVGELGLKITASLEERIEQTVDTKSQEGFSDFEKALQGSVVSQEDLEQSDAEELTDNEAKFHEGKQPNTRADLEAMFK